MCRLTGRPKVFGRPDSQYPLFSLFSPFQCKPERRSSALRGQENRLGFYAKKGNAEKAKTTDRADTARLLKQVLVYAYKICYVN